MSSDIACEEDSIERIFVEWWQRTDAHRVFAGDRKFNVSVVKERLPQLPSVDPKVFSP